MSLIYSKLCDLLEVADNELFLLRDLHDKMIELAGNDYVYSETHLKRKLEEQYGEHVFFAEISGHRNVICFREMASRIINDKWYTDRRNNFVDDSVRIVLAAAKLVKAQIREAVFNQDQYPSATDFSNINS